MDKQQFSNLLHIQKQAVKIVWSYLLVLGFQETPVFRHGTTLLKR